MVLNWCSKLVVFVVLHLLDKGVDTNAHAQITAHLSITKVDNSCAAFAVNELGDGYRFKIGVHFCIESKSSQLFNLLINRILLIASAIRLGQVRVELIRVELGTAGRESRLVRGGTGSHFCVLHLTAIGLQTHSVDINVGAARVLLVVLLHHFN